MKELKQNYDMNISKWNHTNTTIINVVILVLLPRNNRQKNLANFPTNSAIQQKRKCHGNAINSGDLRRSCVQQTAVDSYLSVLPSNLSVTDRKHGNYARLDSGIRHVTGKYQIRVEKDQFV